MTDTKDTYVQGGKTLRDEFAGLAVQGIMANPRIAIVEGVEFEDMAADSAYRIADAMLEAREKVAKK